MLCRYKDKGSIHFSSPLPKTVYSTQLSLSHSLARHSKDAVLDAKKIAWSSV